jgi:hypothetical protein
MDPQQPLVQNMEALSLTDMAVDEPTVPTFVLPPIPPFRKCAYWSVIATEDNQYSLGLGQFFPPTVNCFHIFLPNVLYNLSGYHNNVCFQGLGPTMSPEEQVDIICADIHLHAQPPYALRLYGIHENSSFDIDTRQEYTDPMCKFDEGVFDYFFDYDIDRVEYELAYEDDVSVDSFGYSPSENEEIIATNVERAEERERLAARNVVRAANQLLLNRFFELLGQRLWQFPGCISLRCSAFIMSPQNLSAVLSCCSFGSLRAFYICDTCGYHQDWRHPDSAPLDEDNEGWCLNDRGDMIITLFNMYPHVFGSVVFLHMAINLSEDKYAAYLDTLIQVFPNLLVLYGSIDKIEGNALTEPIPNITRPMPAVDTMGGSTLNGTEFIAAVRQLYADLDPAMK